MVARKSATTGQTKRTPRKTNTAAQSARHTKLLGELAPVAKEINAFLHAAETADKQAEDRRVSAAVHLAACEKKCAKAKLDFKKWCGEHIVKEDGSARTYDYLRKMLKIGQASDPAKAMLEYRSKIREDNRRSRAKKAQRAAPSSAGRVTHASQPAKSPYLLALDAQKSMEDKQQRDLASEMAGNVGMALIPRDELKAMRGRLEQVDHVSVKAVQDAIKKLGVQEQTTVLRWLTQHLDDERAAREAAKDAWEVPAALKRDKPEESKPAAKAPRKRTSRRKASKASEQQASA